MENKNKIIIITGIIIILLIPLLIVLGISYNNEKNYMSKLIFENTSNKKEVGKIITIEETNKNLYKKINYPEIGRKKVDSEIKKEIDKLSQETEKEYLKDNNEITYYYFIDYENYIGPNNLLSVVINEKIESIDLKLIKDTYYTYIYDIKKGIKLTNKDIFNDGYKEKLEEIINIKLNDDFRYIINDDKLIINRVIEVPLNDIKEYLKFEITEDNYKNETTEEPIKIINEERITTEDIVVYKSNTLDSEIIDTLTKSTTVKVYGEYNNGFSMILYNNKIGYIDSTKIKKIDKKPETITKKTMYVISDANVRDAPNKNGNIIGVLKPETKITKTGEKSGWAIIEYEDGIGYVSMSLLSTTKIEDRKVKPNVPPQGPINPSKPMVALTFDDGPSPSVTPKILDTLEKYNVHATFFDVGSLISKNPNIVKRENKIGEVGIHTYSHKNLNQLKEKAILEEINKSKEAYINVLGKEPKLIRPPYGNANKKVRSLIKDMIIVNWNVDSLDWKYRNKNLTLNEIDKYGNLDGKIILMHSIHAPTAEAVEVLIPDLLDRGYQIVTVTELASYKGYTLKPGIIYTSFK